MALSTSFQAFPFPWSTYSPFLWQSSCTLTHWRWQLLSTDQAHQQMISFYLWSHTKQGITTNLLSYRQYGSGHLDQSPSQVEGNLSLLYPWAALLCLRGSVVLQTQARSCVLLLFGHIFLIVILLTHYFVLDFLNFSDNVYVSLSVLFSDHLKVICLYYNKSVPLLLFSHLSLLCQL